MGIRREKWTQLDVAVQIEAPRKTYRLKKMFVSPGGLFVPTDASLDRGTQLTVRFDVEEQAVVAHAEVWRMLNATQAEDRGIQEGDTGLEIRIVRMEGDGSQILAEHIKKMLLESGGPG